MSHPFQTVHSSAFLSRALNAAESGLASHPASASYYRKYVEESCSMNSTRFGSVPTWATSQVTSVASLSAGLRIFTGLSIRSWEEFVSSPVSRRQTYVWPTDDSYPTFTRRERVLRSRSVLIETLKPVCGMSSDPFVTEEGFNPLLHQPKIQSSLKAHVAQVLHQRTCSDTLFFRQRRGILHVLDVVFS